MKFINKRVVKNKVVLYNVDYNVPMDKRGNVLDDTRIKLTIPTLKYLLDCGVKQIIIMTHIGRPKGKVVKSLKTDIVADKLSKILKRKVFKVDGVVDVDIPRNKKIVMLENTRFCVEEKNNNLKFAKKMASLADIYVNDAFSNAHRRHASCVGVTKYIDSYAGFLMKDELKNLDFSNVKKPFYVIMGGAKVSTKLPVIKRMLKVADKVILGGAMIFTFYKALGFEVGKSLYEEEFVEEIKGLFRSKKLILPIDVVGKSGNLVKYYDYDSMVKRFVGLDIGDKSIHFFKDELKDAKSIFWNGPMGMFEDPNYSKGTYEIAKYLASLKKKGCRVVVGGGDSDEAIKKIHLDHNYTHVSSGGGASLEMITGKKLPAIDALNKKK
jgi:3-phosphoglycerate kinase